MRMLLVKELEDHTLLLLQTTSFSQTTHLLLQFVRQHVCSLWLVPNVQTQSSLLEATGKHILFSGAGPHLSSVVCRLSSVVFLHRLLSFITNTSNSQGAAVMHGTIKRLSSDIQNQIKGVVLYGDTRNQQDNEQIPNFPRDKVRIFCAFGDLVCFGTLTVTAAHLSYSVNVPSAVSFLASKIG